MIPQISTRHIGSDLVQVAVEYGIDFYDDAGNIIDAEVTTDEAEFNTLFDALDDWSHPRWPAAAVGCDSWQRPVYEEVPLVQVQRRNPLTGRVIGGGRGER